MITKWFAKGEKGFTLIEILVVVAILGILAAVAVPAITGYMTAGKDQAAATEMATVQTAVDATIVLAGKVEAGALSKTTDYVIGSHKASEFLRGGLDQLKGTYTIDIDGVVTQVSDGY